MPRAFRKAFQKFRRHENLDLNYRDGAFIRIFPIAGQYGFPLRKLQIAVVPIETDGG